MAVNFMGVVVGDVAHLGAVQVVEIQATSGRRFRIVRPIWTRYVN